MMSIFARVARISWVAMEATDAEAEAEAEADADVDAVVAGIVVDGENLFDVDQESAIK